LSPSRTNIAHPKNASWTSIRASAGVKEGQFITYGKFVGIGHSMQAYEENDWWRYDVAKVNETEVYLVLTGCFKNGTAVLGDGDTWVYDVTLVNKVNGTPSVVNPIIAGNLDKDFMLTPYAFDTLYVNDTQTRMYFGVSRIVNILRFVDIEEHGTETIMTYYYDQDSGMLLEESGQTVDTYNSAETRAFSFTVIETNIFGPKAPWPAEYVYALIVLAAVGVAIAVTAAVVFLRKRKAKKLKPQPWSRSIKKRPE
jgi:hypothetical protein